MNSLIFTRARICTNLIIVAALILCSAAKADGWRVDLSRRVKESAPKEMPTEASDSVGGEKEMKNLLFDLFDSSEPQQELVILNTEKGFVPATVRVRAGGNYRIHLVNVNEKEKNISFVLDAFSENHATYFGKIKTFDIRPKKNGVFRFVSPETAAQGRIVVYPALENSAEPPVSGATIRTPASSEGE